VATTKVGKSLQTLEFNWLRPGDGETDESDNDNCNAAKHEIPLPLLFASLGFGGGSSRGFFGRLLLTHL
jgi:hypothetical protein